MGGPVFNRPVEGVDNGVKHYGVRGKSERENGVGVLGLGSFFGVSGRSENGLAGVNGESINALGVRGVSNASNGVQGFSNIRSGVAGQSNSGDGVFGFSDSHYGVNGHSNSGRGVYGKGLSVGYGVYGESDTNFGVYGTSNVIGVGGRSDTGWGVYGRSDNGYAAFMQGKVRVTGYLYKDGGGFEIDHPLDPANKYLYHSFVESPDMKNIYDGVVALDEKGEAEIEFPDWFDALNKDFRYQLTPIGAPGPNLYIAEEIPDGVTNYSNSSSNSNNSRFKVAGGTPGMKVSWQMTGIRKDPWANANRIKVEEEKPDKERGYYTHPELYGQPEERGIGHMLLPAEEKACS